MRRLLGPALSLLFLLVTGWVTVGCFRFLWGIEWLPTGLWAALFVLSLGILCLLLPWLVMLPIWAGLLLAREIERWWTGVELALEPLPCVEPGRSFPVRITVKPRRAGVRLTSLEVILSEERAIPMVEWMEHGGHVCLINLGAWSVEYSRETHLWRSVGLVEHPLELSGPEPFGVTLRLPESAAEFPMVSSLPVLSGCSGHGEWPGDMVPKAYRLRLRLEVRVATSASPDGFSLHRDFP
ncbi:MAG: hypothetical protein AB1758_32600 [Candidatus Eremiobacterota bacterium]